MRLENYKKVTSIEEAYSLLEKEKNIILGGGAWLKLGNSKKDTGIDLEKLELNEIRVMDSAVHIGAMTTLYQLETSQELKDIFNGIISESASKIMGVQVRNIATIGGTVCGKYGFSDLITPLLAVGAILHFYKEGKLSLEDFLTRKGKHKDILLEVIIPKGNGRGNVEIFKKTSIDFSLINLAVVQVKGSDDLRIAIGARPSVAKLKVIKANDLLVGNKDITGDHYDLHSLHEKVNEIVNDFNFGTNQRASKEYRIELAKALLQKSVKVVLG